jgi:hypothetical protein
MAALGVASPGDMPSIGDLARDTGAVRIDIAQCALGSPFQKFTTLLYARLASRRNFSTSRRDAARCAIGTWRTPSARRASSVMAPPARRPPEHTHLRCAAP